MDGCIHDDDDATKLQEAVGGYIEVVVALGGLDLRVYAAEVYTKQEAEDSEDEVTPAGVSEGALVHGLERRREDHWGGGRSHLYHRHLGIHNV